MEVTLLVEYMDWKRYPKPENLDSFYQRIRYKYSNMKIDLVIVSDDAAFNFTLKYRDKIFTDIPIVFCGIYSDDS